MSIITLTTDFGTGSPYVAAMKGVILTINSAATVVDITHAVPAQDIRHAAVVLEEVADRFPPAPSTSWWSIRAWGPIAEIVYVRAGRQQYVAPDNGLLQPGDRQHAAVEDHPPGRAAVLAGRRFHDFSRPRHHGAGRRPAEPGPGPRRARPAAGAADRRGMAAGAAAGAAIAGHVIEVDSFGNLVTNIAADMFAGRPTDGRVCMVCSIYETWGVYGSYAAQPQGTLVALVGSSGRLELAIVGDNAAARLGVTVGTPVVMAWE